MKNSTEKRERRVPLLLTDTEFASLSHGAVRAGLSLSGYIRTRALDAKRAEDQGDYPKLRPDVFT